MMSDFEISGFSELQEDLKKAIKIYPDKAIETLEAEGRSFKKTAKANTKKMVKEHTGNLTRGFRTTKAQGYRENMEVYFCAENKKNPHFHLVEHGHDLYVGGQGKKPIKKIGYVQGKHMLEKTIVEYRNVLPGRLEKMRDEILKGAGLI